MLENNITLENKLQESCLTGPVPYLKLFGWDQSNERPCMYRVKIE